jgi:hypothetical protein
MKPSFLLVVLLAAGTASAQGTDFALNDGKVRFRVPATWTAIMEKSDGNPQAIVFQVPDPAAQGTDDAASITVKTRQLRAAGDFADAVQNELALSKAQTGYESDASASDSGVHRYFVMRGKTRYAIRDKFVLIGTVAAQVRCQRPLLDATTKEWTSAYDSGCNSVAASVQ